MRKSVLLLASIAVLFISGAALVTLEKPAQAAFPGENGKIAFNAWSGYTDSEIYTIKADSSELRQITDNSFGDYRPAFSPDGAKMVFDQYQVVEDSKDSPWNPEIMVTDSSSTGEVSQLTQNDSLDENAAWSPDGSKIAFYTHRDGNTEIYVMNADGTDPRNITNTPEFAEVAPVWSPDGSKIAFHGFHESAGTSTFPFSEIFVVNADGTDRKRLTNNTYNDNSPDWSPDGSQLVFGRYLNLEQMYDIYTVNVDGTNEKPVTSDTNRSEEDPVWSPDGSKIAFTSMARNRAEDIHTINTDGTGDTNVTNTPNVFESNPDWQANTAPTVSGMRPSPASKTRDRTPLISAVVRDTQDNLAKANVKLYVDGKAKPFSYSKATDKLTHTSKKLSLGKHTVRVVATDSSKAVGAKAWSFTVDMVKPTISGMSPKHKSAIKDTTPTIKATVRDNMTNLQKANIKLYMGDKLISAKKYSYNAKTDVLLYNSPKLAKGKKMVKIVATDAAKNVGAKSWYFTIK